MTQDEIIHMVYEAGGVKGEHTVLNNTWFELTAEQLERFAALVAAHEREKQAEQNPIGYVYNEEDYNGSVIRRGKRDSSWVPVYTIPISIEAAVLAEREACAKVCDEPSYMQQRAKTSAECAAAIRARSGHAS